MKAYRQRQCQYNYHPCQLVHVIPGNALLISVCLLMLPVLGLVTEHVQLATTYYMNPIDRCSHVTFSHTHLMLPSLNNVLPAMVLQNRVVRLNVGCMSCFSSHFSTLCAPTSLSLSMYSSVERSMVGLLVLLLLFLSGDIELNPGPLGECLDQCKISTACSLIDMSEFAAMHVSVQKQNGFNNGLGYYNCVALFVVLRRILWEQIIVNFTILP